MTTSTGSASDRLSAMVASSPSAGLLRYRENYRGQGKETVVPRRVCRAGMTRLTGRRRGNTRAGMNNSSRPAVVSGLSEIAADYRFILCDVWGVIHNGVRGYPA